MTEKYVLKVDIDHETGEEHCTVLKTDETTNMTNWIEIYSAMYIHHSILEPLIDELNKIHNSYDCSEKHAIRLWKENEQLKEQNQRLSEQKHIYKQDWKHLCIDKELLDSENEQLRQRCKELRNNLIDHSALIDMLETVRALDIGDMIWNTMGYKTQTEFSDDFAHYREKAKRKWRE